MLYYSAVGAIGAILAISIAALSRSQFYVISGLAPLFPTFTLIAIVLAYKNKGISQMHEVMTFGLYSVVPYIVFLVAAYFLSNKISITPAIVTSLVLWLVAAYAIYAIWTSR